MFLKHCSILLFLLFPIAVAAQVEENMEDWLQEGASEEQVAGISDMIQEYVFDKVNINDTVAMADVPFISPFQQTALRNYITLHGQLLSLKELSFVPGFDSITIGLLGMIATAEPYNKGDAGWRLWQGRHSVLTGIGGTVEQAAGYAALENHGVYRGQTCIASLKDNDGNELYTEAEEKQVYTAEAADTMIDIMKGVIKSGTAAKMGWYDISSTEAAGKTGTTNGSKDGWFCGVTPYYSIAVWVGYDTPKELANLYGSSYPAAIWKAAMSSLIEGYEAKSFSLPNKMSDTPTGEKYLPGREATEELVSGYTVADYRADRETGEAIRAVNSQMTAVSPLTDPNAASTVATLYAQCQASLAGIKDLNYMAKLINETNAAYATAVSQTGTVVTTPDSSTVTTDNTGTTDTTLPVDGMQGAPVNGEVIAN